jgi:hypothetical protein
MSRPGSAVNAGSCAATCGTLVADTAANRPRFRFRGESPIRIGEFGYTHHWHSGLDIRILKGPVTENWQLPRNFWIAITPSHPFAHQL